MFFYILLLGRKHVEFLGYNEAIAQVFHICSCYLSEGILSDSQETENTETLEGSVRILSESLDILKDSIAIRDQAITVLQSRVTECLGDPRGGFRLL